MLAAANGGKVPKRMADGGQPGPAFDPLMSAQTASSVQVQDAPKIARP